MGWFPAARWLLLVGLAVALGQHTETWASMSVAEGEQEEQVSGEFVEEDEVLVLTQSNFAQALQKHPLLLVEFYAPWCRPCQALAPEYAKAAAVLKDEGSPVRLAKVDAVEERLLSAEFGATEYPVLKLFRDGNRTHPANFTGRDAEGIVKWLKRKAGPSAVLLEDAEEAAAFLDAHTVAVVGFFSVSTLAHASSCCSCRRLGRLCTPEAGGGPGGWPGASMPLLLPLSRELSLPVMLPQNASRIFGAQVPNHLLLFLNKTVDSQLELLDSFRGAASAFRGKVLFVLADVDGEGAGVLHYFGLKSQDAPAIRFIHIETNTKYRLDTDELSAATVHTFCRDVLGGKVQPHLMSEEIPRDWDKQPVKVLVGKNFEQVAFDEAKSVFVKFYAPWCPHSKAMAPAWEELGQKYDGHPDIVIAQMDATANEVAGLPVPAYPTLYYFPAGDERKVWGLGWEGGYAGVQASCVSGGGCQPRVVTGKDELSLQRVETLRSDF
uniref:protein disulfide-isomerase n=1 Tax=Varanus komodoensis TaxID=61221 RepID=A0A8D2KQU1_VARKO